MDRQIEQPAPAGPVSTWVEPAGPVKAEFIKCSAIDNLCAPVYPSPVKFFPLRAGDDPLVFYENLKRGLARCIYVQPHLSGIIRKDETGRNIIEIPEAPNAGANFEYSDLRNDPDVPSYEQFREAGWPIADGEVDGLSKLRPDPFPSCQEGEPIICPKFSVIRGGMVLLIPVTHVIGDLVQCKDFAGVWARNTRAVAEARARGEPEPPLPEQTPAHLMDRSRLRPDVPIEEDLDKLAARAAKLPHMTFLDPRDPEKIGEIISGLFTTARLTDQDLATSSEDDLRELRSGVWTFPLESLKKLQGAALMASPKGTKLSSIDCLTAFTWQRFFLAKFAPDKPGPTPAPQTTRIVFAGSVRHRLTPPLPIEYLPACVDLFPVDAKTSDFISSDPKSLANASRTVRTVNDGWSESAYMEMCEIAQSHPMSPGLVPTGPIDILITDHTRSTKDLLEDWGPGMGLCEALREPYFGRVPPAGELTLLPRWGDGKVEVMVAGEAVALQRLKEDKLMNSLAKCQFIMHDFVEAVAKSNGKAKL